MQIPERVLVGTRNGKRVLNRPVVLLVGVVTGSSGAATWFLLTTELSLSALVLPVFLFLGLFWGTAIRRAFQSRLSSFPAWTEAGNDCGSPPHARGRANRRPGSPVNAGRPFETRWSALPALSAVVAMLSLGRMTRTTSSEPQL